MKKKSKSKKGQAQKPSTSVSKGRSWRSSPSSPKDLLRRFLEEYCASLQTPCGPNDVHYVTMEYSGGSGFVSTVRVPKLGNTVAFEGVQIPEFVGERAGNKKLAEHRAAKKLLHYFAAWKAENARLASEVLSKKSCKLLASDLLSSQESGILFLKPRDLSPLEYRERIAEARPHFKHFVEEEGDKYEIPHRIWLRRAGFNGDFHKVMKDFPGVLAISYKREAVKKYQDGQVNSTIRHIKTLKPATIDSNALRPIHPKKVAVLGDPIDKSDSWSVVYEPVDRPLVYCSYDHQKRSQTLTWDIFSMERLALSKDEVVDVIKNMTPFYQAVLEYGDTISARDKEMLDADVTSIQGGESPQEETEE